MYTDVVSTAAQYVTAAQSYYRMALQFAQMRGSLDTEDASVSSMLLRLKKPVSYESHLGRHFDAYA